MDRRQQLRDARLYFVADRDGMARALDGALAGGDARGAGAEVAALEHDDRPPTRAGAPGHGEADDAAADDRYVVAVGVCGNWISSRFAGMTRISS